MKPPRDSRALADIVAPSSDPAAPGHLLPRREKGRGTKSCAGSASPSPLVGEGARRADEGGRTQSANKKNFARSLRKNQTEREVELWRLLRDRRFAGYKFRRQVPIGAYVADFVCYSSKLVIELDGSQHAESQHDRARDLELARRGFRVLRVWNNELTERREAVLDAVWHALQEEIKR